MKVHYRCKMWAWRSSVLHLQLLDVFNRMSQLYFSSVRSIDPPCSMAAGARREVIIFNSMTTNFVYDQ